MSDKESFIKYYNLCNNICSCRDNFDLPTKIAINFKDYYQRIKKGEKAIDILRDMNVIRVCCLNNYLNLSLDPMIDRSSDRFVDDSGFPRISKDTRDLTPLNPPPDFPSLI